MVIKHHDQKQIGNNGLISSHNSGPNPSLRAVRGWRPHWNREAREAASLTHSAGFLLQPEPPAHGWHGSRWPGLFHSNRQSRKCPSRLAYRYSKGSSSTEVPLLK